MPLDEFPALIERGPDQRYALQDIARLVRLWRLDLPLHE